MSDENFIKSSYLSIYDTEFDPFNAFTKLQIKAVSDVIQPSDSLLDVGTADGRFLNHFAKKIRKGVGVDIDSQMIEKATLVNNYKERITYKFGDCLSLPFKSDMFDVSYCFALLVICGDIKLAISELKRVTKKSGTIIIDLPNRRSISFYKWRKHYQGSNQKFSAFTLKQSLKILKELQIEVDLIYSQGFIKQVLYLRGFNRFSKVFDVPFVAEFDIWLSSKLVFKNFSSRWIMICKV
jgi:ubiquinone/menaquinone biosynthesis C-methylase UbiE